MLGRFCALRAVVDIAFVAQALWIRAFITAFSFLFRLFSQGSGGASSTAWEVADYIKNALGDDVFSFFPHHPTTEVVPTGQCS